MDKMMRRYAKAVVAVASAQEIIDGIEAEQEARKIVIQAASIARDPKAPQWKINLLAQNKMVWDSAGPEQRHNRNARWQLARAKARLKIVEKEMSLHRAQLYAQGKEPHYDG